MMLVEKQTCNRARLLSLQGDDYNHIMVEALADRLAEAFAEKLHQIVRKELWGYASEEDFTTEDLLKVKYQGGWGGWGQITHLHDADPSMQACCLTLRCSRCPCVSVTGQS